jgi:3-hydroxypropanoate dehydrogenase
MQIAQEITSPGAQAVPGDAAGRLADSALDLLFRTARSRNAWLARELPADIARQLYDLAKWGPTAANSTPARFVFVRSAPAKERLRPHLTRGNIEKVMTAPCCVIIAYDSRFYDELPKLFPTRDMRALFVGKESLIEETARRNSSLQGAYLMMAARALGLDCGPMSGFDAASVDAEFFPDGRWKSNFLCAIGYGSTEKLLPRNPRLDFTEACLEL